jgi:glyoxylase-like metal-dependent hydrolase (beta-lactamase superfamily II)
MLISRVGLIVMATVALALPSGAPAQGAPVAPSMRVMAATTKKLSPHVYAIPANLRGGVANIGIVVGSRAVLVIESGLGKPNGQAILDETRKVAPDRRIYVIATHSHPEHIGGEQAFPASAVILRPLGQQIEVDSAKGKRLIETFRGMSPDNAVLLKDFAYRPADIILTGPTTPLDLGGVTVDIVDASPAHTDGDAAFLVREDGVLFTGDVVQQNFVPVLGGEHSSTTSWLTQIDKLEKLPATIIVPSHTAITDRQAFADMRAMVSFVHDDWATIKGKGLDAKAAADQLVADVKARFPACINADLLRMYIARI